MSLCCNQSKRSTATLLPLLVALVFSSCCHHWASTASQIVCEAIKRDASAEPSCQPAGDCDAATLSAEPEIGCSGDEFCASSRQSDGRKINYTNGLYSIDGLSNFSSNGSIGYCLSHPDFGGDFGGCVPHQNIRSLHVQNLNIGYKPIDMKLYEATVTWDYFVSEGDPDYTIAAGVKAYALVVKGPGINSNGYCVCINSSLRLREYSLILEYEASTGEELDVSMYTFPYTTQQPPVKRDSWRAPSNCSDYQSRLPYNSSTCGLPYYGKPRSVKLDKNTTHTTLSWDKPCYQKSDACKLLEMDTAFLPHSGPTKYYLTTVINNIKSYFVVRNTRTVTISTTDHVDFELYTHTPCSGMCTDQHISNCSQPATSQGELDSDTCCNVSSSESTVTASPTSPTNTLTDDNRHDYLVIYIPVGVVMAFALLFLAILLLLVRYLRKPGRISFPRDPPHQLLPRPVLVVFSPRTPELESQTIMQCLVSDLSESSYGIESSTLGMGQLRQNPYDWIEEWHGKASAVLCVCNKEFLEDWTDAVADVDSKPQVVRGLKRLFEGDLQRGASDTNNYAVVKMKVTDDQFIPPLLRHRPVYMYHEVERIARFAHNVPQYHL